LDAVGFFLGPLRVRVVVVLALLEEIVLVRFPFNDVVRVVVALVALPVIWIDLVLAVAAFWADIIAIGGLVGRLGVAVASVACALFEDVFGYVKTFCFVAAITDFFKVSSVVADALLGEIHDENL
jgi:hypothetical protein